MVRALHIHEDRLIDCFYAERRGEPLDPPTAEHLADCTSCNSRYAEMARFLNTLRDEADAAVDAIFTADRLHAQQLQIAHRLEHVGRAARVISFPGRFVGRRMSPSAPRSVTRWVAAAAAAGLFIGATASLFFNEQVRATHTARSFAGRQILNPTRPSRLTPGASPVSIDADDSFLSDLDVALERPRTRELMAYDNLTPHVREVSTVR